MFMKYNIKRSFLHSSGIFDVLTYDPNSSNPMAAMAVYQQVKPQPS